MEIYWDLAAWFSRIATITISGILFCRFIKPFLRHNTLRHKWNVWMTGVVYIFTMLFLAVIPFEMYGMTAYAIGILAFFLAVYWYDRRNLEQKLFLMFLLYLVNWISYGIALLPREILFRYVIFSNEVITLTTRVYFVIYLLTEAIFILCDYCVTRLLLGVLDRIYLYKHENMTRKELGLMLAIPLSGIIGYVSFTFFSNIYESDTKWYIQDVHSSYQWVIGLYQAIAYGAVVAAVVLYQDMKKNHRREKENAVLAGQLESLEKHISEVEALYQNIKGMRHDLGNHIMILENLCKEGEQREAIGYLKEMKEQFYEAETEIKSGNPVTDILLTERKREAENREISFQCDFHYPEGASVNAFDVSIILYNALNNAIEGAEGCEKPFIRLFSYREKNVLMIEIANSLKERVIIEEENGLPLTTKDNKEDHGYGLINIRRVAQKYFGDIAIEQRDGMFVLHIMLMLA